MAGFEVTISAMGTAASNMASLIEQYREEAAQVMNAANTLAEGWQGDASDTFKEGVTTMKSWMDEMSTLLESYPQALTKNSETYTEADTTGASYFK